MALFHGVLLCCMAASVASFFSKKALSKREKRSIERLRKALRKSATSGSFRTWGTEVSCFRGKGRWASGPDRPGKWGFKQTSDLVGSFVKSMHGGGYDFKVTKSTQMVTSTGDTKETAKIVTETLLRGTKAFMRFKKAPQVFRQVFPNRWFDVKNHDLGDLVDVEGLAANMRLFDESELDERKTMGVTVTSTVMEDGTRAKCFRVAVNSAIVKKIDKDKNVTPGSLMGEVVSEGFMDDVYGGANAWTEYLVSEREGLIVGIQSKARSSRVNEESGDWECDVEVRRSLRVYDYDQPMSLPDPAASGAV
ncbi:hypothetical protein BSKO_03034 [Bryopsis sp. KO-2023]|nr:hypothetical protein BSKO_03034 [Bryopsis sp. KO-2023]